MTFIDIVTIVLRYGSLIINNGFFFFTERRLQLTFTKYFNYWSLTFWLIPNERINVIYFPAGSAQNQNETYLLFSWVGPMYPYSCPTGCSWSLGRSLEDGLCHRQWSLCNLLACAAPVSIICKLQKCKSTEFRRRFYSFQDHGRQLG